MNKTEITPQIDPITILSGSNDSEAGVDRIGSASFDLTYFGAATLTWTKFDIFPLFPVMSNP